MIRALAQAHSHDAPGTIDGPERPAYDDWLARFDKLSHRDIGAIRAHISAAALQPPLIVVRVDRQAEAHLDRTLSSLEAQLFEHWRALVCFDPECSVQQFERVQSRASVDPRLRACRIPLITAASLVPQHTETFVLVSGGVVLREHAVYMLAIAAATSNASILYADEDRLGKDGERVDPTFKPAFSPELFRQCNYLGSCIFLRTGRAVPKTVILEFLSRPRSVDSLVDDIVAGLRADDVLHIPHILFHALSDGHVRRPPLPAAVAADRSVPLVSIIIPTKDKIDLLRTCLRSIHDKTRYPSDKLEIVIVDHDSREDEAIAFLRKTGQARTARILSYTGGFNFSRMNNRAAARSQADVLVFLNNDTQIIDPLWLRRLVDFAMSREVAVVGGKLLYPDGTVQHGGVVVGVQCSAVHCHVGLPGEDDKASGLANVTREVASMTAACMAIRRELFTELGGFDERLATAFNDTDLCLRALERGYRNIYIGHALAIHHECKTRGRDATPEQIATFQREGDLVRSRHRRYFKADPYYNPNFSLAGLYELACPPRRSKPWRGHAGRSAGLGILLLSNSHATDHCLSRLVDLQARHLIAAGHRVYVGGPKTYAEREYAGCTRIDAELAEEAVRIAFANDIDCIVAHDPAFFAAAKWTGTWPKVICCQHGELPQELFQDERARWEAEIRLAFSLADAVMADTVTPGRVTAGELQASARRLEALLEELCFPATTAGAAACIATAATKAPATSDTRSRRAMKRARAPERDEDGGDRKAFYAALGSLSGSELVDQAYLAILGRYADHSGRRHYCEQLSLGASRSQIVWEIASSDEAKSRGVCVREVMTEAGFGYVEDANTRKSGLASGVMKLCRRLLPPNRTR